ncbi:MAG: phosphoribosylanthranilate isomerase [Aquificae bacterium]|nr:phosphoribosylanthranilate isomerase [Aquificota bacterium]
MGLIKVCGLTTPMQAEKVASLGATHIGMVHFPKSPRHLTLGEIGKIAGRLKGKAVPVAVVVNPEYTLVEELLNLVEVVQLHGDETVEFAESFPRDRIIKAFRVKDERDIKRIEPFAERGYTVLIDAFVEGVYGGSGRRIDTALAQKIVKTFPKVILSGGLNHQNVGELLEEVKPYGVDASSGLEVKPGVKDLKKTEIFIKKAREFYESDNKTA